MFALGPALKLSQVSVLDDLKGHAATRRDGAKSASARATWWSPWQVALSLALLATAGLFVRAAVVAGRADPGYRLDRQFCS